MAKVAPSNIKPEAKAKVCTRQVKEDDGRQHGCDTVIPKGMSECPNRRAHIYPMVTGFCGVGFCEGKQPTYANGIPAKTCPIWKYCPCDCHAQIDKMCLMTGMPRVLMENPKYRRPHNPYVMPEPGEKFDQPAATEQAIPKPKSPLIEVVVPRFTETPTGKRARGQLEVQVLEVCSAFSKGQIEVEDLTPAVIAQEIDEVEPPSVGAIGAVFDRWTALGFANCGKKPVRFISFTVDGLMYGLDYMKAKAKRDAKTKEASQARGGTRLGIS